MTPPPLRLAVRLVLLLSTAAPALATVAAVAPAAAQSSTPPDVVRLRDGTFLRGTIVEHSPTHLVLMLPTGETRTYPADQVEHAGPDVPPGPALVQQPIVAAPAPEPRQPMARLHVRAARPGLSLQRFAGSATVTLWTPDGAGTGQMQQYGLVCHAPCDVEVPEGIQELGVGQGVGAAQRVGAFDLRGDITLDLRYHDRNGHRIAGWTVLGVGAAAGAGLIVGGLLSTSYFGDVDLTMVGIGSALASASLIIGLVFGLMNDAPSIEIGADGVRF